jgi:hypothetical protein
MIYKKNFLPPHLSPRSQQQQQQQPHPLDTRTKTTYNNTFRDYRDPYGQALKPSDSSVSSSIDAGFYGNFNSAPHATSNIPSQTQPMLQMPSPRQQAPAPIPSFGMPQSAQPPYNGPQTTLPPLQPAPLSSILPYSAPVRMTPQPPLPSQMASSRAIPVRAYQERLQPQPQQQKLEMSDLEKQAHMRSMERPRLRKSDSELMRVSNRLQADSFDSGRPSNPYWFGRAGPVESGGLSSPSTYQKKNHSYFKRLK